MRILFVFPFCSPEVNSIAGGPLYLGESGHDVLVITSSYSKSLKGEVRSPESEIIGGTEFFRPYRNSVDIIRKPFKKWRIIANKVAKFKPDVVIGFGDFNYKLPLRISRAFKIPLFFYLEYLRDDKLSPPLRGRTLLKKYLPFLHNFIAEKFICFLARNCSAIMFAYYDDIKHIPKIESYGTKAFYVPWCTETGSEGISVKREHNVGIYIGSLEPFKNSQELVKAIPIILDQSNTVRFIVVGPGAFAVDIKQLAKRYGERLTYTEAVPRSEAMRLIRSVGYGYTPVTDCGLGFIGDCWGTGTPLITTHDLGGFVKSGVDTIVAEDYEDLPRAINDLLNSEENYTNLQQEGLRRYNENYTGRAVGERYLRILRECLAEAD